MTKKIEKKSYVALIEWGDGTSDYKILTDRHEKVLTAIDTWFCAEMKKTDKTVTRLVWSEVVYSMNF